MATEEAFENEDFHAKEALVSAVDKRMFLLSSTLIDSTINRNSKSYSEYAQFTIQVYSGNMASSERGQARGS